MLLTFQTTHLRAALIRVNTFSKVLEQSKIRVEIKEQFAVLSSVSNFLHTQVRVDYTSSELPVDSVFIIDDIHRIINAIAHFSHILTSIRIDDVLSTIAIMISGNKQIDISLSKDYDFGIFPREKMLHGISIMDIDIIKKRCDAIKYAVDKSMPNLYAIFFTNNIIYATDSYKFAINTFDTYRTDFDFAIPIQALPIIFKTMDSIARVQHSANYIYFIDKYFNEIAINKGKFTNVNVTKFLDTPNGVTTRVNVDELKEAITFLSIYAVTEKADGIAWNNENLKLYDGNRASLTKIEISDNFNFTICFGARLMLSCLKQFNTTFVEITLTKPNEVITIQSGNHKCLLMPRSCKNDPFQKN